MRVLFVRGCTPQERYSSEVFNGDSVDGGRDVAVQFLFVAFVHLLRTVIGAER